MSKMSPSRKLELTFGYSEFVRQMALGMLRQRYPHASEREIFLREARQRLGADLFYKVYSQELPDDRPARVRI